MMAPTLAVFQRVRPRKLYFTRVFLSGPCYTVLGHMGTSAVVGQSSSEGCNTAARSGLRLAAGDRPTSVQHIARPPTNRSPMRRRAWQKVRQESDDAGAYLRCSTYAPWRRRACRGVCRQQCGHFAKSGKGVSMRNRQHRRYIDAAAHKLGPSREIRETLRGGADAEEAIKWSQPRSCSGRFSSSLLRPKDLSSSRRPAVVSFFRIASGGSNHTRTVQVFYPSRSPGSS